MKSSELKNKLLHFFRFRRMFLFISTETKVGRFKADVLISNEKEIIEIETKTTYSDYLKDYQKPKHAIYKKPSNYYLAKMPNRFYFACGDNIAERLLAHLEGSPYGLILVKEGEITKRGVFCQILKQAELLQPKFSKQTHKKILQRLSSELIRLRLKYLT